MNVEVILYSGAIGLVVIGVLGLLWHNNLFRMLLALAIAEAGANILLVLAGFREGAIAPILLGDNSGMLMNDPVPQALVLTAIVIGVGVQALALSLIMKVYQHYHTLDMRIIKQKMEIDIALRAGVPAPVSAHSPERPEDSPERTGNSPEQVVAISNPEPEAENALSPSGGRNHA